MQNAEAYNLLEDVIDFLIEAGNSPGRTDEQYRAAASELIRLRDKWIAPRMKTEEDNPFRTESPA